MVTGMIRLRDNYDRCSYEYRTNELRVLYENLTSVRQEINVKSLGKSLEIGSESYKIVRDLNEHCLRNHCTWSGRSIIYF